MKNSQMTSLSTNDLRVVTGGYKYLPVFGPICELPGPVRPGYPTTDPVIPPYYTK